MPDTQEVLKLLGATDATIFTTNELAAATKLHPATIRRRFMDEPGVIRVGHAGIRGRRQRYTLRIPAPVAARVFAQLMVGAVQI